MSPAPSKVAILLATYCGAEFLGEQLESFRAQTHRDWELYVSDDGSTDDSVAIVEAFAASVDQRVVVRAGAGAGFWRNFLSLIPRGEIAAGYFAFSDQDDVWLPEKLAKAVAWLQAVPPERPALYFSRTELIARDGAALGLSPLFRRAPIFQNALVQNIGGGNTMVFNDAARRLLAQTPDDVALVSHDWWAYQLITGAGGIAHYDPWPSLKYRQHGQNLVGSNVGLRARLVRLVAFAGGRVIGWNATNIAALNSVRHLLHPDHVRVLDRFAQARSAGFLMRPYWLWRAGVYRQKAVETIGLYLGALLGRI
ncbi:glycosyltransferase family 2 protein [Rhodopseudomonas sp. HC1]|uniref:glycosyltransferase family 2 protein n=1 Tax=Rhodopseudomonas infernalis TaxID=2897386 RepID=UPI001EE92488|nr:glycosyltransferase family 2 protein [Rhodopseudomonas infernalis]MCG6205018.1 glycosyltransferase family 2 protein [Rhodopseudomonas infernalis]